MTVKATDRAAGVALAREPAKPRTDAAREAKPAPKEKQSTPSDAAPSSNENLRFHVDKDSGKTVIAWVDAAGKVLRQTPTEEAMAIAKAIDRYQGVFVNRKA